MDRPMSRTSTGTALTKTESLQYPNAHVGHLTESQYSALESFKSLCKMDGSNRPENEPQDPSYNDATLLRYLRARKFIPEDALQQWRETEAWRKTNKIDQLYETIDVGTYEETRRLYTHWTGRTDRQGIPVYVFEVAPLNSQCMASYEKSIQKFEGNSTISPKLLNLFALCEHMLRFTMPFCSALPNRPYPYTPISQSDNIVDISNVGLRQFWNLKQHMQDASTLMTAHYPETLGRIFIVGAPSFFPTIWSWIRGWFDPVTVSKIFILSKSNTQATLEKYIEPTNIPRKYGGTHDWKFGDLPSLEPTISENLIWDNPRKNDKGENCFPLGPMKWKEDANGDMLAYAIGSVNGVQRDQIIARLPVSDPEIQLKAQNTVETLPLIFAKAYSRNSAPDTEPPTTRDMHARLGSITTCC